MPWLRSNNQNREIYSPATAPPAEESLQRQMEARLAALEAQGARRVQEAFDAGCREGHAQGRAAAENELQPLFQKLAESVRDMADFRPRLRAQAESDIVKLAMAIARRILNRELATDPEAISGLVRVGLERVRVQELIRIRAHPDHVAAIRESIARTGGASQTELVADPTQERGGIIFETTRGDLDVSVETQLREIDRGLTDRLRMSK
jgi:flagellar assembly protein FliH